MQDTETDTQTENQMEKLPCPIPYLHALRTARGPRQELGGQSRSSTGTSRDSSTRVTPCHPLGSKLAGSGSGSWSQELNPGTPAEDLENHMTSVLIARPKASSQILAFKKISHLFLFVKQIYREGVKESEICRSLVHSQMFSTVRAGLFQSQEPGTYSHESARAQGPEPSSTALPGRLARSWIRSKATRT